MTSARLIPANDVTLVDRTEVLNSSFADYFVPMHLTPDQMAAGDRLYDVDIARSVVAVYGRELVGMALLSRRGDLGWVSGVGVVPEWRRRGVARSMMEWVLAEGRAAGVTRFSLETIEANLPARELYKSLGFVETRELLTWRFPAGSDALPIPSELLHPAHPDELLADFDAWHQQPPCWQRAEATLRQMVDRATGHLLVMEDWNAGYLLTADRGDYISILDAGINPDFGPIRAGRVLLQAFSGQHLGRGLSIMNVAADDGLSKALAALRFLVTVRQVEMVCTPAGL